MMTIIHYKNMFNIYLEYNYYIFRIFHYFMGYQKIHVYFRRLKKNIRSVSLGSYPYSNSSTLFQKPMNLIIPINIDTQIFLLNPPIQQKISLCKKMTNLQLETNIFT
jgi:hypothetical protein